MKNVYATPPRRVSETHSALPVSSPLPCSVIPEGLLPSGLAGQLQEPMSGRGGRIEEIRLRAGRRATLTVDGANIPTSVILTSADLTAILTHMCGGSLYAYAQTINQGYITLPDGIRVGVVGRAVCEDGRVIGVCEITGLCIRIPHPHGNMGAPVCRLLRRLNSGPYAPQGVLIYAPPGVGKTTLLRAIAAGMAGGTAFGRNQGPPLRTVVIDTRGELGFDCDEPSLCIDILRGYPRARGVEIATRTMSAQLMVCDEIGDVEEAAALVSAHHGGVPLVATAHGGSVEELLRRTGLRMLHKARLFGAYVGIRRDGRGDFIYRTTEWGEVAL